MASEPAPNASWHPALMPNTAPPPPPTTITTSPMTTTTTASTIPTTSSPTAEPRESNAVDQTSEVRHTTTADDDHEDGGAWFDNDDDGDDEAADTWLNQPDSTSSNKITEPEPEPETTPHIQPADTEPVVETDADPAVVSDATRSQQPTTAQHASSMSFARTVSHEISFTDDDDGDWNLPRTDSDPFKFMAPSDRTNSFPVVPMAEPDSLAQQYEHRRLPSTQAADILEEAEEDEDEDAGGELHGFSNSSTESRGGADFSDGVNLSHKPSHAPSQSIGGQLHDVVGDANEARYEEGLPLIPKQQETFEHGSSHDVSLNNGAISNAFADDDNDDDFFAQTQENETASAAPAISLQRKSTMQVMSSANPSVPSQLSTFESNCTFLEDTTDEAQDQPDRTSGADVDLSSKWEAAFDGSGDEDDFLLDDQDGGAEVDPSGFLGSDDEGFLDDDDEHVGTPVLPQPEAAPVAQTQPANRYAPQTYQPAQIPPSASAPSLPSTIGGVPPTGSFYNNVMQQGPIPAPIVSQEKTESFAGKSKAGYSSPYDLPSDFISSNIKPRKRASLQSMETTSQSAPPFGGANVQALPSMPPPSGNFQGPPQPPTKPLNSAGSSQSFFEDLPMSNKVRPASRHSARAPSPAQPPVPTGPPGPLGISGIQQSPLASQFQPEDVPHEPSSIANLVAPGKVNPYASLPSAPAMPSMANTGNRYSPAPSQAAAKSSTAPPLAQSNRYSPAPGVSRQLNPTSPPGFVASSHAFLPHLPRNSSPLHHVEISNEKGPGSNLESRMNRVSSLPPTREVNEEEDVSLANRSVSASQHFTPGPDSRYAAAAVPTSGRHGAASPPKRTNSNYLPQQVPSAQPGVSLPLRSQTQSPGAMRNHRSLAPAHDITGRPSTSHFETSDTSTKASSESAYATVGRARGPSLTGSVVPPANGTESDPLQRWQGTPIISWGVGGSLITSFPKSVPRYAMNQSTPTVFRTSSEIKIRSLKELAPLPERLSKFPGPLKGKSKKKEALAWLTAGIDILEKDIPDVSMHHQLSLEAKRAIERLLLWKLLKVFLDNDGHLEGNPTVEGAVRDILSPQNLTTSTGGAEVPYGNDSLSFGLSGGEAATAKSDNVDSVSVEQICQDLLKGDREKAVWAAVDKRLWGHAMLISHTVSPDLYKQVSQEFVRKEVNAGQKNVSLGALYQVMSGNFEDSVNELVPSHTRAGLQLMSTQATSATTTDVTQGLDKWRETLTLILSNRSPEDIRGLRALGQLLSNYGRAEAAHICFIFSRHVSVFGGLDDPNVDFVLIGSDHRTQADQFAKETEALQLTEIYEYGLSLASPTAASSTAPHLAAYKLAHAITLAENGLREKAMQYCDSIAVSMTAQTKRSPYHHPILEVAVDDFMRRLKQAPQEEGSSWISKPSMNKVSDSMWNRFNKFVSGDEAEGNGKGPAGEENGPFARIASTPNISRSPSVNNFELYGGGGGSPGYPSGPSAQATAAAVAAAMANSRYAPFHPPAAPVQNPYEFVSQQTAAPQQQLPSNGITGNQYTPSAAYEAPSYSQSNGLEKPNTGYPGLQTESSYGYQPQVPEQGYQPQVQEQAIHSNVGSAAGAGSYQPSPSSSYQPYGLQDSPNFTNLASGDSSAQGYQPSSFEPPQMTDFAAHTNNNGDDIATNAASTGGYEAPSYEPYSYEPPSYAPDAEGGEDDALKPKKKSFMDDDDDIPGLRPQEKTKEQVDKENADMVRKIAEEEEKRAAEQAAGKKGWGFGGWFAGKRSETPDQGKKAIKAKLGEANSFVYDPDLKRWINKAAGAENVEAPKATPPPPKGMAPRSISGTPPPLSAPTPPPPGTRSISNPLEAASPPGSRDGMAMPPPMMRSASNMSATGPPMAPPSRPTTSMSNASSIDDLLGAPGPRKAGAKKPRKSGRYVDVMGK